LALVFAILLALNATPARAADTNITAISELLTFAQNTLLQAAFDFRATGQTAAHADIDQALATLTQVTANLSDPAVQQAFGDKDFNKLIKLLQKAQQITLKAQVKADQTSPFGKTTAVIKGITLAARTVYSGNLLLGKPLLAEVNPTNPALFSSSAGFHKPGELVEFQIDLSGCDEAPTITVQNATGFNNSVDLNSVSLDPATGRVTLLMGPAEGGASVQVTACGKTVSRLLFNYGSSDAQKLPYGFPQDLTVGTYAITLSGTICTIYYTDTDCYTTTSDLPTIGLGTIPLVNVSAFAKALGQAANSVAAGFNEPNATLGSEFSPVSGGSFSWTVSVTGSAGGCECAATATLTISQQQLPQRPPAANQPRHPASCDGG
jgi:hypothetical protein